MPCTSQTRANSRHRKLDFFLEHWQKFWNKQIGNTSNNISFCITTDHLEKLCKHKNIYYDHKQVRDLNIRHHSLLTRAIWNKVNLPKDHIIWLEILIYNKLIFLEVSHSQMGQAATRPFAPFSLRCDISDNLLVTNQMRDNTLKQYHAFISTNFKINRQTIALFQQSPYFRKILHFHHNITTASNAQLKRI